MKFEELALIEPILSALRTCGYTHPTPIQAKSIPAMLAGRDLCATAQTGTGKTAAFALPILQRLSARPGKGIRALILVPTRELAVQTGLALATYGKNLPAVRHAVVHGGSGIDEQRVLLAAGTDILIATPGRLLDLCGHNLVRLDRIETLVLDEADRMLDLGFIQHVQTVVERLPARRQTALYSATLPKEIETLAGEILRDPVRVAVARSAAVAEGITQYVVYVEPPEKRPKLLAILLADPGIRHALVFTRTRHGVERINRFLIKGGVRSAALHGDMPQAERTRVLTNFAKGLSRVLVATDVAARGIDFEGVSHVLNYDLPDVPESYVHRIGRTARAGATGVAISLCATNEQAILARIERLTRQKLVPLPDGR